ncbi:ribonuclease HI family protein [Phycisphaerales bacterium AB-hyl4]|uniref:Ribonuclease HI family protein n=1 Tax=Natronomicrosphaera hydrolytica TaxID=3242702 RepID=A0ABV4UAW0_9BACT
MNLIIHIDGGSRGNPGPAGVGVVLHDADTRKPVHEAGYFVGRTTNNVAEYTGLLRALEIAHEHNAASVTVHSDSQLMVRQLHGQYKVKSADLKPLFDKARQALGRFKQWKLDHVPREKNERADELANLAMDVRKDVIAVVNGQASKSTAAPRAAAAAPASAKAIDTETMWQVRIEGESEVCPAHMPADHEFTMGSTVGEPNLCTHAATAIFSTRLPNWSASRRMANVRCAACDRTIRIRRS